jgi:hypothetical protein
VGARGSAIILMSAVDNMCPDTKAAVIGLARDNGYTSPPYGFWDMADPITPGA